MRPLTIRDVLRLLEALDEPEDHLKKLYEWQVERGLTVLRLAAAGLAAIVVAVAAAIMRQDVKADSTATVVTAIAVLLTSAFLVEQYQRVALLEREYVAALGLLRELSPLVPVLRLLGVPDDAG